MIVTTGQLLVWCGSGRRAANVCGTLIGGWSEFEKKGHSGGSRKAGQPRFASLMGIEREPSREGAAWGGERTGSPVWFSRIFVLPWSFHKVWFYQLPVLPHNTCARRLLLPSGLVHVCTADLLSQIAFATDAIHLVHEKRQPSKRR